MLEEYDLYYCRLAETLEAVSLSRDMRRRFEEIFLEGDIETDYDGLISGRDFEVVFRNVLSSALIKLAQTMTDLLDKRYQEVRLRRLTVEKFMMKNLEVHKPVERRPNFPQEEDEDEEPAEDDQDQLVFQSYDNNLYDSINI